MPPKILLILFLILLAGCGGKKVIVKDKPAELVTINPVANAAIAWQVDLGKTVEDVGIRLRPYIKNNTVIAASQDGQVAAFTLSGDKLWQINIGHSISAGVGGNENMVIIAGEAKVTALNINNGELLWETAVQSDVFARPAASFDYVLVRVSDGLLIAFNALTGEKIWQYQGYVPTLQLRGSSAPLIIQEQAVLQGFDDGKLVLLRITDGYPAWELFLSSRSGRTEIERMNDIDSDIVVDELTGIAFVAGYQSELAAVKLETGEKRWQQPFSSYQAPYIENRDLYVVDEESIVYAFSQDSAVEIWQQDALAHRNLTGLAKAGEFLLAGDYQGYIHLISSVDGSLAGRTKIDSEAILTQPIVYQDRVFIQTQTGKLIVIVIS